MIEKIFYIDLLFNDGLVHVEVKTPIEADTDHNFNLWANGVHAGIAAYLRETQTDFNFNKPDVKVKEVEHKHRFLFNEVSEDNESLWFYCTKTRCQNLIKVSRVELYKQLLGDFYE